MKVKESDTGDEIPMFSGYKKAAVYYREHGMEISFTSPGWITEEDLRKKGLSVPTCGAA